MSRTQNSVLLTTPFVYLSALLMTPIFGKSIDFFSAQSKALARYCLTSVANASGDGCFAIHES